MIPKIENKYKSIFHVRHEYTENDMFVVFNVIDHLYSNSTL